MQWREVRKASVYEWALAVQAHRRGQVRRDRRALLLLNAWSQDEVTLNDLYGTAPSQNGDTKALRSLKERVMKRRGITRDLTHATLN